PAGAADPARERVGRQPATGRRARDRDVAAALAEEAAAAGLVGRVVEGRALRICAAQAELRERHAERAVGPRRASRAERAIGAGGGGVRELRPGPRDEEVEDRGGRRLLALGERRKLLVEPAAHDRRGTAETLERRCPQHSRAGGPLLVPEARQHKLEDRRL